MNKHSKESASNIDKTMLQAQWQTFVKFPSWESFENFVVEICISKTITQFSKGSHQGNFIKCVTELATTSCLVNVVGTLECSFIEQHPLRICDIILIFLVKQQCNFQRIETNETLGLRGLCCSMNEHSKESASNIDKIILQAQWQTFRKFPCWEPFENFVVEICRGLCCSMNKHSKECQQH